MTNQTTSKFWNGATWLKDESTGKTRKFPSHNRLLQASGALTYRFEELSIEIEPNCFAGMFNGSCNVTYWNDEDGLNWSVGDIEVECNDGRKVTLEEQYPYNTTSGRLYLAIWGELTDGAFKDAIDGRVRAEIEL